MTARDDAPDWEDPRHALARHGLKPKRSWSQSFLVSRAAHQAVVRAADIHHGDPVVELGAGLGTLTRMLAHAGAHVFAVERDPDLQRVLTHDLGAAQVEVLAADAAALDYDALRAKAGAPLRVVGNIPYSVTGAILRSVTDAHAHLACVVLTLQREVRDRLLAKPGTSAYGASTVFTSAAFEINAVRTVPRGAFYPAPRVDSAIVRLLPRAVPLAIEDEPFRHVVHAAFGARRKTLRNALAQTANGALADAALARAGLDGTRRGETLSVQEFQALADAWTAR